MAAVFAVMSQVVLNRVPLKDIASKGSGAEIIGSLLSGYKLNRFS